MPADRATSRARAWSPKHDGDLRRFVSEGLTDLQIARRLGYGDAWWIVIKRRKTLGLTKRASYNCQAIRAAETPKPPRGARRPCLRCTQPFNSEGHHNRLCKECRKDTGTVFTTPAAVIR